MATGTKVQLRLGDRVVAEVAFEGDELRIGRMKENDLVINNVAVSRFHAVLRRVGEAFEIEDLGSENGTFVAGIPVRGTALVPSGVELTVGKHVLTIRAGDADSPPPPAAGRSDVWDAAQTYFAPALAPRALEPEPAAEPEPELVVAEEEAESPAEPVACAVPDAAERAPAASIDSPDPDGLFAFGEEDVVEAPALCAVPVLAPEFDVVPQEPELPCAPVAQPELGGQTALFDFGAMDDLGLSDPSLLRAAAAQAAESTPAPTPRYPGLIVARGGKVERVLPFVGVELIVGRGPRCDLVLPTGGVSRRHARFVREGEAIQVLDLGSANGIRVNGERATQRELQQGDVVSIDDYSLTFVLDHQPLHAAVPCVVAASEDRAAGATTVLHDAPLASIPERDLVTASDEDELPLDLEKALELSAEVSTAPPASASRVSEAQWSIEVVLASEGLPPALQRVLRELGTDELRLPAELRLRRRP